MLDISIPNLRFRDKLILDSTNTIFFYIAPSSLWNLPVPKIRDL